MKRLACLVISLLGLSCATTGPAPDPWGAPMTTVPGPARSIGSYSAGCIAGAVSLAPDGKGYQMMRLGRRRFYGHPSLIRFITELAHSADDIGAGPLLMGDLGQTRGGPLRTGHASHQIGLDVDVWFWHPAHAEQTSLTLAEREETSAQSVVAASGREFDPAYWNDSIPKVLELAAKHPDVERIFVDALIKKELCLKAKDHSWLGKLRPWWNHRDHFHVRLRCPGGDLECRRQAPVPAGDGCDATLEWWFTEEATVKVQVEGKGSGGPVLPEACAAVLASP